MTTLNKEETELMNSITRIFKLAYKISNCTDADVFVDYSSYCNNINVSLFMDGWKPGVTGAKLIDYETITAELLADCEAALKGIWHNELVCDLCDNYCIFSRCDSITDAELEEKCEHCPLVEMEVVK